MTKVVIEDRRGDEIKLSELNSGDCFVYEDELWMVTDEFENGTNRNIVCLNTGVLTFLKNSTPIEKVSNVTISFT